MIPESILIYLLSLLCLLLSYLVFTLSKKVNKHKALLSQLIDANKYNFDEDIKYLNFIIGFKCTAYYEMAIKPLNDYKDKRLLNDEDLNKAIAEIVESILSYISKEYMLVLSKYFPTESIKMYITEVVYSSIVKSFNDLNNTKIKRMNNIQSQESNTFKKSDID